MTKFGQTNNHTAVDHINIIEKYLGQGKIDIALMNKTSKLPSDILDRYVEEQAEIVKDDLKNTQSLMVVRGNFASDTIHEKQNADKLVRSMFRHDSHKLAKGIMKLV
jgi:2-phospho-L-lactate transferase/gluconeogenesis factor (CofD/UPF0052 family)